MRTQRSRRISPPSQRAESPVGLRGAGLFFREDDYWTVAYDGTVLRLRDARGLQYLAQLLARPGEPVAAADLMGATRDAGTAPSPAALDPEHARIAVTKRIKDSIKRIAARHPALGYHLDAAVRTGLHCRYVPDPSRQVTWKVERAEAACIALEGHAAPDAGGGAHPHGGRVHPSGSTRAAALENGTLKRRSGNE